MPIQVVCPKCRVNQTVGNDKAGLRLRCRSCGNIISIPAGDMAPPPYIAGAIGSATPIRTRLTPGLPKLRPLIYGLVGLMIIGALAFRWWFNPPANVRINIPQNGTMSTTGMDRDSIQKAGAPENMTSPIFSDEVRKVLNEARAVEIREGTSKHFFSLLQSVAMQLPELNLSTESGVVVWNKLMLYQHGLHLNAFRFTSPLDVDGDLFWCFAAPSGVGSWYILPASGSMRGFDAFQQSTDLEIEGLDLPKSAKVVTQQLLDGNIRRRETYIVYFSAKSTGEQPFRVAARILPTRDYYRRDTVPSRILRRIGLAELPIVAPTPGSRVLEGHTDSVVHLTWRPNGELISIDADGNVCIWNVDEAKLISKTATGQRIVNAAVSSDGKLAILLEQKNHRASVFDLETLQIVSELPVDRGEPRFVCFAKDDKNVFVSYARGWEPKPFQEEIVCWSLETKQVLARRLVKGLQFRGMQAIQNGLRVIGSVAKGQNSLQAAYADLPFDLSTAPTIVAHTGLINMSSCRIQNNTRDLFADFYGLIKVRGPDSGEETDRMSAIPNHLYAACHLADDRYVALACAEKVVQLFDTVEQQICMTWSGHEDAVLRVSASPDGKTLVSSESDGSIRLWDATQRNLVPQQEESLVDSQGHQLKTIPGSEFVMGSSPNYSYNRDYVPMQTYLRWEQPRHRVRISRPYYLGSREVTIGQFRRFVDATKYVTTAEKNGQGGKVIESVEQGFVQKPELTWQNPGYAVTENHPVAQISWEDARAYCAWLSELEKATYRLPTEAEWEFACGAHPETQFSFLVHDEIFPLCCNAADASIREVVGQNYNTASLWNDGHAFAAEVGTYLPNKFGLCEMLGNVWELCQDTWADHYEIPSAPDEVSVDPVRNDGKLHVCRGGSFYFNAQDARACRRDNMKPDEVEADVGFRVLREIPVQKTRN